MEPHINTYNDERTAIYAVGYYGRVGVRAEVSKVNPKQVIIHYEELTESS